MTLQQLRTLQAIVDNGLSVSRAAQALHTTQPGVSKIVKALEAELGVELFVRAANRLVDLTDHGRKALDIARRMLRDARALRSLNEAVADAAVGTFRVATTHIHARYTLVPAVRQFVAEFPRVELALQQSSPAEVVAAVVDGSIDLGLSTLPARTPADLGTMDAYEFERCLIVPADHALLRERPPTLRRIAAFPFVAYHEGLSSGWTVQKEFQRQGLRPSVIVRATDATVVKAYVSAGIGIAVTPRMAVDEQADRGIRVIDTGNLFPSSVAVFMFRKDHRLPVHAQRLIDLVMAR